MSIESAIIALEQLGCTTAFLDEDPAPYDVRIWGGFGEGEMYDSGSFYIFQKQGKWGIQLFGPAQLTPQLDVETLPNALINIQRLFKKIPLFTDEGFDREGIITKLKSAGFAINDPDPDLREISGGTGEKERSGYYSTKPFLIFQRGEYFMVVVLKSMPFVIHKITTSLVEAVDTVIDYYKDTK